MPVGQGLSDYPWLSNANIQMIVETAASTLARFRPRTFLDRLTMVEAEDNELMGRLTVRPIMADIISDGQKTPVYSGGQMEMILNNLANVKTGRRLEQNEINEIAKLARGVGRAKKEDARYDIEIRIGETVANDILDRLNWLACGMMQDSVVYDKLDYKFTSTFGTPSDLKVTVSPLWSLDAGSTGNTSATPVSDILAMDTVDATTYGLGPFDRVTMAGTTFDFMCRTTDFLSKAWYVLGSAFNLVAANTLVSSRAKMLEIAPDIFGGKEIVIDDKVNRIQNGDGTFTTARVLAANKVILDRKANGPREWDMGNGILTETIVASLMGSPTFQDHPKISFDGGFGPLAWWSPRNVNMDPPGITCYGAFRGFPRKHIPECSAVLTVW